MTSVGRAAIIAALFLYSVLLTPPAGAQDVTLSARTGDLRITGTMRGYDGEFYRVETEFGLLTLDAQGVICAGPGCPDLTAFVAEATIAGAPHMGLTVFPALVSAFAETRGLDLRYAVTDALTFTQVLAEPVSGRDVMRLAYRLSSSDAGLADLDAGRADIALSQRDRPGPAFGRAVALDAYVPLVARGNPLTAVAMDDLAAVLAGEITDWGALGGEAGAQIQVHAFAAGTGLQQHLEDTLFPGRNVPPPAETIRHETPAALADAVARDPYALGVGVFSDTGAANVLDLTGACGFVLSATPLTIKAEDYPLPAPSFLFTPQRRLPLAVRDLLEFMSGPAAQVAIRRAGFIDQSPLQTGIAGQGGRLANAIAAAGDEVDLAELQRLAAAMRDVRRLSITFRFQDGAASLDTQSRGNLDDLARALESGTYAGQEMVLAGFSDGAGAASANRRLAMRRAEAVRTALMDATHLPAAARPRLSVDSFGEALPIACDDTDWGRRANRRVEVWLR